MFYHALPGWLERALARVGHLRAKYEFSSVVSKIESIEVGGGNI